MALLETGAENIYVGLCTKLISVKMMIRALDVKSENGDIYDVYDVNITSAI